MITASGDMVWWLFDFRPITSVGKLQNGETMELKLDTESERGKESLGHEASKVCVASKPER